MFRKFAWGLLLFVVGFCVLAVIAAQLDPVKPTNTAAAKPRARPTATWTPKPIGQPAPQPRATPKPTAKPVTYGLSAIGHFPTVQTVGVPFVMTFTLTNTGNVGYPVTFDLSGCSDHWVVDNMTAPFGDIQPNDSGDWLAGWLERGHHFQVRILLAPKDPGRHVCDVDIYRTQDTATNSPIGDPLVMLSGNAAINPA